jgi:large subunit ribosomal protein L10
VGLDGWDRGGTWDGPWSQCNGTAERSAVLASETNVDRSQKAEVVSEFRQRLQDVSLVVVTRQSGLTVAESTELRRRMRQAGAHYKVTKNRLARLALDGSKFTDLAPLLKGPTGMASSKDPVAAAKVAVEFAKTNDKMQIVGGVLDGKLLDADGVKALATLPSLDELRGKLVGMLQTPATRIAMVLQAPAGQVARVLGAYASKGEAA